MSLLRAIKLTVWACSSHPTTRPAVAHNVAIIGAGPGGLVAARYLQQVGFTPVLFEQGDGVGGQWRVGAPYSSVWPGMRTNTSRVMTAFSDLPHPVVTPPYPTGEQLGTYLEGYAGHFGLLERTRVRTRVELLDRASDGGWDVHARDASGTLHREAFSHVVVASGRYHAPALPRLDGMRGFRPGGISHVATYRGTEPYRGQRVLVAGHSISALEIASELALRGAARVIVAARRHRYVLQKILAGVPIEHRVYTRYAAMAAESFAQDVVAASVKELILRTSGHPSQFGAPVHSEDVFEAGFTQSQFYLALVAEGRIVPRPWVSRIDGHVVHFADDTSEDVDAIVFGTGYHLDVPFLGPSIREALRLDAVHADLHQHTFHPDLPGLAFVGLYEQSGPYFPTLELQARRVAYTWGGAVPAPSREAMVAGVDAYRARRGTSQVLRMHALARLWAREAGVEPDPARWPHLARALYFGPQSPASFRLDGPDALPDAPTRVAEDALTFGTLNDLNLTETEKAQLTTLASARNDPNFTRFVQSL
ncbi:MAG: NAD(P)-binding domain-containing protein [Cytophagaceae bacterium]|nr:NAD(P)-binding domain-containing protein [Gemmatimonadaceae bacterium]